MTNTQQAYTKNVFTEFRCLPIAAGDASRLTNENLQKAMTVNAILNDYNFNLSPKSVIALAQSSSLDGFVKLFESCLDTVKSKPMYPDFPTQVMAMDAAQYRFHQLVHYFSVYGIEDLFGVEVDKGWLPPVEETEKTERDARLLPKRTLSLLEGDAFYIHPLHRVLTKRQRMTLPEQEMIFQLVELRGAKQMAEDMHGKKVVFKQNLMTLCNAILDTCDKDTAVALLTSLCQHTGDVLKVCDYALTRHKYHFTKAQKRVWVQTLESYPVSDFRANVILSGKKAERAELVLRYLDYNSFSHSDDHARVVKQLRNGELRSWHSQLHSYIQKGNQKETLEFIGKRPGMLLRMVNQLSKLGYKTEDLVQALQTNADSLSVQTLLSVIQHFGQQEEKQELFQGMQEVLRSVLTGKEAPFAHQKVFLRKGMFDWDESYVAQGAEGGYLREGLAIRIPEEVERMRFFVYWNDKQRVDIDLHAEAFKPNGDYCHIGWNGDYNKEGIITSGDITHSNAAEFIDIDLKTTTVERVIPHIHSFTGQPFSKIETIYVGMMVVKNMGKNIKLYDVANCFYSHNLRGDNVSMTYGIIYPQERLLRLRMKEEGYYDGVKASSNDNVHVAFSLMDYVNLLLETQGCTVVETEEEADVILSLEKGEEENVVSLLDNNYFLD